MKVAYAQFNFHIGHFSDNQRKIIEGIEQAKDQNADVVLFPELCVTGYPPRDFLEFDDFIHEVEKCIEKIAAACIGITAVVGAPTKNTSGRGKKLYNSALVLEDGKVASIHHKMLLPNYDIFDEYRYFEPAKNVGCATINGKKVAITICEDLWEAGNKSMYQVHPMEMLIKEQPTCIFNIAASPYNQKQSELRRQTFKENVDLFGLDIHYVNHVGSQTELIFDGDSMHYTADHQCFSLPTFKEGLSCNLIAQKNGSALESIHNALTLGIKDYFKKLGFKKAIVGLSGGIDSAVTLALAAEALGAKNVLAVLMPSEFSSNHSVDDAIRLVKNLKCAHYTLPIKKNYQQFLTTLEEPFKNTSFGLAEENLQARIRGVLLMAISNKQGHILLNTSNKSEAAVGYGTLYGDMAGGLSVIGDLYKTEVFELAEWMNRNGEIIPVNTITKPPSAELRPNQKDEDSLPPYDVMDTVLQLYIEERKGPKQIIEMGYDAPLVNRILKLVNQSEYKRYQAPPTLRVSGKAFGMGRRMPIVAKYLV